MNGVCGCCAGTQVVVPLSEVNPPGRSALKYRVLTYATSLETMLARLVGLPQLTTRDPADPSIALLDAWATVADVLTFYQERIANEGYLPTARERRSVLELARLIGYRLRPGVAASVQLAFTAAHDFRGTIPAGTRAQSIPGPGEAPQFFETSADLEARDEWNALQPRRTRPQVITLPFRSAATDDPSHVPLTAADVIDTLYFDGITTQLVPGSALIVVFGNGAGEQQLRIVRSAGEQAEQNRTEVTLAAEERFASIALELFLAKAAYLFPGSDILARVASIVTVLLENFGESSSVAVRASFVRAALAELALQQQLATARGFTRVSAFLDQLRHTLATTSPDRFAAARTTGQSGQAGSSFSVLSADFSGSPLVRLGELVDRLALARSVQPAGALRLGRSLSASFAPDADAAARLIAALKPAAAGTLYDAWSSVTTPRSRVQILAARVTASLFASSFAGAAVIDANRAAQFTQPAIDTAWISLGTPDAALSTPDEMYDRIALDAAYQGVTLGSRIAVDRPQETGSGRVVSYHLVTDVRTTSMDTGTGFSANVTVLTVAPPWLPKTGLTSVGVLRGTIVYAQTEPLDLAEEPLDTDVAGDRIDLDRIYDGLEPGRWIIVSGTRTDVAGTSGVTASEPAMIAGVAQGSDAPFCAPFPLAQPPFREVLYTTPPDANGDRLVVGRLAGPLGELPPPAVFGQRYCGQVQLASGVYATAYVPTAAERSGKFPSFDGLLVDPDGGNAPFENGTIGEKGLREGLFAWRVSDEKLHTVLTLANALAYRYDRMNVTLYGNVADATHGQTTGEVLGDGDASRAFASFTLGQSPLTYVSAPTPSGASSTLAVRANELEWHELDDAGEARPAQRTYVTREDDAQRTIVTFGDGTHGARLPTGTANVKARYRYGLGKAGNVAAGQISQLATQPLGAEGVLNPLAATGGADADRIDQARENAPLTVAALDRLVSVRDYADFARTYAGIGKAVAARLSDGLKQVVHVTVAGADDAPLDVSSDAYRNLLASLLAYGDPHLPVAVGVRRVRLLVMSAALAILPDYAWEDVEPRVRAALLAHFAFGARALGQTAFLSEAVRTAQETDGVAFVSFTVFDGVPEDIGAAQLAGLGTSLRLHAFVRAEAPRVDATAPPGAPRRLVPAELVFLTPDVPETLILAEARA